MKEAIRWDDPEDRKRWVSALRSALHDALAAGDNATRRLSERMLSRAEARRKLQEAEKRIETLQRDRSALASPRRRAPMITSLARRSAERLDDFASSFSCLDGVPGTCPFEAGALVGWLSKIDHYKNPDAIAAAVFLLWLYSCREIQGDEPMVGPSGTDRAARARAQSLGDSPLVRGAPRRLDRDARSPRRLDPLPLVPRSPRVTPGNPAASSANRAASGARPSSPLRAEITANPRRFSPSARPLAPSAPPRPTSGDPISGVERSPASSAPPAAAPATSPAAFTCPRDHPASDHATAEDRSAALAD